MTQNYIQEFPELIIAKKVTKNELLISAGSTYGLKQIFPQMHRFFGAYRTPID
jgi:hypothetical protein